MADDMGFTDIGSFGAEFDTPNLDGLAENGIRLTSFHTSVSCSPLRGGSTGHSRYCKAVQAIGTIMTGLQIEGQPVGDYYMDDKKLEKLPADFYSNRSYADFLVDAIREGRDSGKPFFAYFAPTAAHDPIHVPEPWLSKYRGDYDEGYEVLKEERIARAKELGLIDQNAPAPGFNAKMRRWESLSAEERAIESRIMEGYAGMIDNMDYHLGRIFDFLRDIGEYDNTIIIFHCRQWPESTHRRRIPWQLWYGMDGFF